jgi:hypothetical protein
MHSELCNPKSANQYAIGNLTSAISVFLSCALMLSACRPATRERIDARASDEWTRSYPLDEGGRVSITNRNGGVEIEGGEGSTVEVRAERVTHATSQKTAQDLLPRIGITEEIKPELVSVRTEGIEGILLGVSFEVTYHVKIPEWASVRVQTGTGEITVTGISGRLVANTGSGDIKAARLSGGVETRTSNGGIVVDLARLGTDPVTLRTVNGSVQLTLPASSDANLAASAVNGEVSVTGLTFEPTGEPGPERGRGKRLRGRLNNGGTSIDLQTVNGSIEISAPAAPPAKQD